MRYSICVHLSLFQPADGGCECVCVLLALCYWYCLAASHDPGHCHWAVVATVSATTNKSQLAHSPPHLTVPLLPLAFPLGLRYRDIVIWIATIIDIDFCHDVIPTDRPCLGGLLPFLQNTMNFREMGRRSCPCVRHCVTSCQVVRPLSCPKLITRHDNIQTLQRTCKFSEIRLNG